MSFRFQKFSAIYPTFASQFARDHPELQTASHAQLLAALEATYYAQSGAIPREFRRLGLKVQHSFPALEQLQKAWAHENGVQYSERWLEEIVLAQVERFRADVIYFDDLYLFSPALRARVRGVAKRGALLIGWRSAPTDDFRAFADLDLILTTAPNLASRLRRHCRTLLIRHAFDSEILGHLGSSPRDIPAAFLGSLGNRVGYHARRYALLEWLMERVPLEVWGTTAPRPMSAWARALDEVSHRANQLLPPTLLSREARTRVPLLRRGAFWMAPPTTPDIERRFPDRCHSPLFGLAYYGLLARSRIVLNIHIDSAEEFAGNARLFEATGVGACLLTDRKVNLPEMFIPGVEVETYGTAEECEQKILELLADERRRASVATAGQARTLGEHTVQQRAKELLVVLREILARRRASA
jgi:hypothetical protein